MSKMACHCGGVISDTLVPSPTEGWIYPDQALEGYYAVVCRDIVAFLAAVQAGRRDEWIGQFFSRQYPTDVGDEGIVNDIMSIYARQVSLSIAECEQCGRLWVQRSPGVNAYRSWAPDEPGYTGALRLDTAGRA